MKKTKPVSNKKEFIVCAAIMYDDRIITGFRHSDCLEIIENINSLCPIPNRESQGFLTSKHRYVSRTEAFKIAKENNQIWHNMHGNLEDNQLTSEDLY